MIRYVAFDLGLHNLHGPSTEVDKKSSAPKKSCDRADIKIINNLCFSNRNSFVFPTETPFMRNLRSRQIRELRISYELENTFVSSLFLWFWVNPTFLFPFLQNLEHGPIIYKLFNIFIMARRKDLIKSKTLFLLQYWVRANYELQIPTWHI